MEHHGLTLKSGTEVTNFTPGTVSTFPATPTEGLVVRHLGDSVYKPGLYLYTALNGWTDLLNVKTRGANPSIGELNYVAESLRMGKKLYLDEDFSLGVNNIVVYNNSGGTNVSHSRVTLSGAPNSSGFVVQITHTGTFSSPGLGGFYQIINSAANKIFIQQFVAKIPVGYSLNTAANSLGAQPSDYFLGLSVGTGKWETYTRIAICGDSGSFSFGGHVYLTPTTGALPTSGSPLNWYLASCTCFDLFDTSQDFQTKQPNIVSGDNTTKSFVTVADWNTAMPSGFAESYTAANMPTSGWHHLIHTRHTNEANNYAFQIANSFGTDNYFVRNIANGSPTTWKTLLHAGNFATLLNPQSFSWTGIHNFVSNKGAGSTVGANNLYQLEAFSNDGGAAGMSFHRGGFYAVNFGLDPDNVLRIGGWSALANRWQLDMSGNMTIAGGFTANGTSGATNGFITPLYSVNNRNPIWRFGNADGYGLSYFQGSSGLNGTDSVGVHFGNPTSALSSTNFTPGGIETKEIRATGEVWAFYSDKRLKTEIKPIENCLDKIRDWKPVFYRGNEIAKFLGYDTEKVQSGLLAQDVQKTAPELVGPAPIDSNYLTLKYEKIVPYLVGAIQELSLEISKLRG
jgi:Chaperone of endosialidase